MKTHPLSRLLLGLAAGFVSAFASPPGPGPERVIAAAKVSTILASELNLEGTGFYLDQGKWAAIHPDKNKEASAKFTVPVGNARYHIVLHAVGENDGSSTYEVYLAGNLVGRFECPLSNVPFAEGERYTQDWHGIDISEGTTLEVRARIGSKDGKEWSRGRWSKIEFRPQEGGGGHGQSQLDLARTQRAALFKPVPRQPHGDAAINIGGELRAWHKVTLNLAGPFAAETDTTPNPFTDFRFDVTFTHESGTPSYTVPGYFAADGNAAETSATAGTVWRAHLSPDRGGKWNYQIAFTRGSNAATYGGGTPVAPYDGLTGSFTVKGSDKQAPDFRAGGRLTYRGGHYLIAAGSGQPFLKAGADAPETLLAFTDFDDTLALKQEVPLKTWAPHVADWRAGDPTWKGDKGKGLIGALNYLGAKGANAVSFLTYNAAGDGDNIWPFVARDEKLHYDCSRLDQWAIVFEHAQARGIFLHFKLQENESDDHRAGARKTPKVIPEALDAGATGPERRLYFREMIARFGHNLALNWNLGEENTQTPDEQRAMAQYIRDTDPYDHLLVIHSFPEQQNEVYENLLGKQSELTGASAQNSWKVAHQRTLHWVRASAAAGRPWVVCNDEQGPANLGVPPDLGYKGYSGKDAQGKDVGYDEHDIRKATLWGTLMAGGAGVEYYFGYQLPENDLLLQDFRSRDRSWEFCRIALGFFRDHAIPLTRMRNADELVGNAALDNSRYCLAEAGKLYLVYLPVGGEASLDLSGAPGIFAVSWFNPRTGGPVTPGPRVTGGAAVQLTAPDSQDWLAVVRAVPAFAAGSGAKVLVVGGGNYHDFAQWFNRADVATLAAAGHRPLYVDDPETAAVALADADVLVLTSALGWPATPSFRSAVAAHLEAGRGFVALHSGVWRTWPDWTEYESRYIGIAANSHPKPFEFEVAVRQPAHPVMQGLPATFKVTDELYEVTTRPGGVSVSVLAETQASPGSKQTHASVWVPERAKGRTVGIALGHDGRVRSTPEFNRLLVNAVAWTARP